MMGRRSLDMAQKRGARRVTRALADATGRSDDELLAAHDQTVATSEIPILC